MLFPREACEGACATENKRSVSPGRSHTLRLRSKCYYEGRISGLSPEEVIFSRLDESSGLTPQFEREKERNSAP
jgi:hypothetical protein